MSIGRFTLTVILCAFAFGLILLFSSLTSEYIVRREQTQLFKEAFHNANARVVSQICFVRRDGAGLFRMLVDNCESIVFNEIKNSANLLLVEDPLFATELMRLDRKRGSVVNYMLTQEDISRIENYSLAVHRSIGKQLENHKEDIYRLIDGLNNWVSLWMGILSVIGIFIPLIFSFKAAEESKKMENKTLSLEKVTGELKNKGNEFSAKLKSMTASFYELEGNYQKTASNAKSALCIVTAASTIEKLRAIAERLPALGAQGVIAAGKNITMLVRDLRCVTGEEAQGIRLELLAQVNDILNGVRKNGSMSAKITNRLNSFVTSFDSSLRNKINVAEVLISLEALGEEFITQDFSSQA